MTTDRAASVLARLKNKSIEQDISLQQLLNLFCQEEFIRRLSDSSYRENLVLKGGYLLYSISDFTTRPTVDADYLLKNYPSNIETIGKLVNGIITKSSKNDFIEFQLRNIIEISEAREYHGFRVNLIGHIGRTKTPFSIDFGVGDVIVPNAVERTLPVLLDGFEKPVVLTYSLESTVAEKLDAIISLMEASSRMKDFYDIYFLATTFDFEGRKLQLAIYQTLLNRETPYEADSVAVIPRLSYSKDIQRRWDTFCLKILQFELGIELVLDTITDFISPPYQSMFEEHKFTKKWSYLDRKYV